MKLHEHQAKSILAKYGVPIPRGQVAFDPESVQKIANDLGGGAIVLKGQVHSGGRGKAGAVKLAKSPKEAMHLSKELIGKTLFFPQANSHLKIDSLLVEEALEIKTEIYLAITLPNRSAKRGLTRCSASDLILFARLFSHPGSKNLS
jgi:succinyl-CoA synthetase beta subunit